MILRLFDNERVSETLNMKIDFDYIYMYIQGVQKLTLPF